ncbi:Hypothetical protein MSYG_0979 [Malassezia sympodialis ATCC 42132]|uniref:Dolichyl-diphosphooligosaccharide-protein glycosyltransferase subunit OST5 n=1 Tax=Malassezia sympodialis (strain ATCC 42132) TaxID=1230383 RepID=A0A1M8A2L1_MALS4|nr:Hypothetical protein MSYG_0979 [Malassezia sympodialis ATCC 42132]
MSGMIELYDRVQREFIEWPVWEPSIPPKFFPQIAVVTLALAFLMAFYFTTLPRAGSSIKEPIVAVAGSLLAGIGVVALFNSVGIYL